MGFERDRLNAELERATAPLWAEIKKLRAVNAELVAAASAAHSAIVLGNGREIDWNAIADELGQALARAKEQPQK